MASSISRTILLLASTLTTMGCQSGAATKAMRPLAGRSVVVHPAAATAANALSLAEQRVHAAPHDVEARRALAQAYFVAGRFRSAAQACDDALMLAPGDDALRLRKALALLAQGNQIAAIGELDRIRALPDAGLAFAIAGRPERGIELLTAAARSPDAGPRTRQNLALAYALDGQWARARVIAGQDLDPAALEVRVRQWAELAASADPARQTVGLLAIAPAFDDVGRPVELAYVQPAMGASQVSAMAPAAALPVAPAPKTVEHASVTTVAAKATLAGGIATRAGGRWVVQLAAYDRAELREENWKRLSQRHADLLGNYPALRSEVTIGARRYYRLALAGFDGRSQAVDLCESLQAKGRACFVRATSQMPGGQTSRA